MVDKKMNKHQLKPLTILTGEDNTAIYKIIDSISLFDDISPIFIYSNIFRKRFYDESIDFFNIPEHLLEMRDRKRIDFFEHYDPKFMPVQLNDLKTKSVVFYYFPETGLHPSKQHRLARYIARLVNEGVYFVIATHSTTVVREFNNLMILKQEEEADETKKIRQDFGYENNEGLAPENVAMYITENQRGGVHLKEVAIDDLGFEQTAFDDTLAEMISFQNRLLREQR